MKMRKRYWIAGTATAAATLAVAARLLARPRDADWHKYRDAVFHSEYSRFVEIDGIRVHYQEAGEKSNPALVLIHGFASSTLVWSKVFLHLAAAGFHVIAVDLLGFGYSGKPRDGEYTIAGQASFLMTLLEHLGIQRATFVGSSYGGAVAATCALDHPERVEKLVLVGAVNNNEPLRYNLMRLFGSPVLGEVVSPLLIGSRRLLRWRMKRVYDRHALAVDEKYVDARHFPLRASGTQRAIIRTVRGWDAERISRDAHLIQQPTLLLWGENDIEIPLENGERLHERIPGSRLVVFLDCGHQPHEEYPKAFTELVADFCG
ncbi:MAG TPA: alpha/beta hydrolase [Pyrinomonadaceae bacterium]|jgi:pimeloyl-ACP methyl ester carboxylesterase|nr:alpha/beta hydrolase [Pyrinomonadaceae bacterium]